MIKEATEALPLPLTKEALSKLPSTTGIYFFVARDRILYIGKSVNLKARVLSHIENSKIDTKEAAIVGAATAVHFIIADSEFKALLLESRLIKKYLPAYNSIWRDDKSYLYLKIPVKDEYPKIATVRRENDGRSRYFGPFPSLKVVNEILKEVRRVFPFCTQKEVGGPPCFHAKIGLCNPCPNTIRSGTGDKDRRKKQYRRNILRVIRVFEGQTDPVLRGLYKDLKTLTNAEKYEEALLLRNKINRFERLIHMPFSAARIDEQYDTSEASTGALVSLLSHYFPNLHNIGRIECYDMSSLSFGHAAASMVVFNGGRADKSQYRKFRIRNREANSDFAMIEEVLRRRFRNPWPAPDLIVIDGGRPQVRTVLRSLAGQKLAIPVIGIAKHPDRLIIGTPPLPLVRPAVHNLGFNLVRAIRDESHRFARRYHLLLRDKKYKAA